MLLRPSGTDIFRSLFSLRILGLAGPKPRRLKPALLGAAPDNP